MGGTIVETRTSAGAGSTANPERILLELDGLPQLPDELRRQIESHTSDREVVQGLVNFFAGIEPTTVTAKSAFWKHSLAAGHAASMLAERMQSDITPDGAFLLGFFHDLGKAALFSSFPKSYARVESSLTGDTSCAIERDFFGIDHSIAGRRLASRWGLPADFVETMWLHHSPLEAIPSTIARRGHVQLIALSNLIAHEQDAVHVDAISTRSMAQAMGITSDALESIAGRLGDKVSNSLSWLAETDAGASEHDVHILRARNRALVATNAALVEQEKRLRLVARLGGMVNVFIQGIKPSTTSAELCKSAAGVLCACFRAHVVVLIFERRSLQALNVGLSAGGRDDFELIEAPADFSLDSISGDDPAAVLVTPHDSFAPIMSRYQDRLGQGEMKLLVITDGHKTMGAALVSAEADHFTEIRHHPAQLFSLSTAIAHAASLVKVHEQNMALSDELATANQRIGQARVEFVRQEIGHSIAATAAGIAHELNNPLAVISGRAQMLSQQAADPQVRIALEQIIRQTGAASEIVADLSELAREPALRPQTIDLGSLLKSLRSELISRGLLTDREFTISLPSHSSHVQFDPDLLRQIFRELLSNALDATDPQTRLLTIKVAFNLAEEHIAVTVSDNGRGMKPEILDRVFDPFFSHQPAGRKRGLGLARVSRWLAAGRGKIRIRSAPQQGTQVELMLPTT